VLLAAVLVVLVLRTGGHGAGKPDVKGDKAGEHEERAAEEHGKGEKGEKGEKAAPGPTLKLPDFVIHLRDADSERYARISFELEVKDDKTKEAVTARMPIIRDAFLAYLSDRSAQDLRGGEAMARIKTALSDKLAEIAPGVKNLYVTDMVVQ